ncbi:hypothetical protein LEP1GSC036_0113 [Leptospira weilii str. 2006001853]|uniref:Uncharacterized protein n=1 Tax=Leptospira weilii str. 2006001853 TaxID=1001589 RepID=A0A828YXY1_9LEPT|nr:hypothetical protein LEP1GSC036_0113 [Leptospira weilii str. 2006001853]EMN46016.1 hypothetical protein LEP1GSC086_2287 [Leptospira weilii str. LNT 1234]
MKSASDCPDFLTPNSRYLGSSFKNFSYKIYSFLLNLD